MAGVAGANGMMVGAGGAVGPLSAEGLHAVLQHTFTSDATQRKVRCGAVRCGSTVGFLLVLVDLNSSRVVFHLSPYWTECSFG